METLAVFTLILLFFAEVLTILLGTLLIRHREVLNYFKDTFSFIKADYNPSLEIEHQSFLEGIFNTFKNALRLLGDGNLYQDSVNENDNKSFEINQIITLIGQVLIISGILAILITLGSTIWMIMESDIKINLSH